MAPRAGWASGNPRTDFIALGRGVLPLICGDVIRPSLSWLLNPETPKNLAAEMARSRDPGGFAALAALARTDPASAATKDLAARRIATILAAKGGVIADTTVGDCLELLGALRRQRRQQHQPVLLPAAARAGRLPGNGTAHGPGVQDAGAADSGAAGRPLSRRLPAGPRPDHRLPAGTTAGGRPCDAAEPVPRPGRPVLARPGTAPSRDQLAAARPRRGRSLETAGHRQDAPDHRPRRAGHRIGRPAT